MPRSVLIQTNFVVGELDPLLRGRIDLNQYYNALQKATNVVIQPQGGARRREGLQYIDTLPANLASQAIKLVPFQFNVLDSYMFAIVPGRVYIYKNKALLTNINASGNNYLAVAGFTAGVIPGLKFAQSADTIIFVQEDLAPLKFVRGGTDTSWTVSTIAFDEIPSYAYTLTVSTPTSGHLTPSATSGNVTLTSQNSAFASGDVGQYINAEPQGRAKIVEYKTNTTVKAIVEIPFFDTSNIPQGSWEIERGYEASWSSGRGWPRAVTFHEGRLFFAGAKSRPTTVWGSRVSDFFNFQYGEGLDDEAVEATIDTSQLNTITDIYSGRDLQIFSIGGEFYVPQATLEPITPTNFIIRTSTKIGSKNNFPVIGLDSGTLFLQRQGKSVNELLFTDTEATYIANNVTLLSGHLVKNPVDMALNRATSTDDTDRLYVVNGDDGTIMCISLLRSQSVIAPSEFVTDGLFKAVSVDVNTVYVVVARSVNGSTAYYVETFNRDLTMDSAKFANTSGASASMAHLVAKTVKVVRDGIVESDKTVPGGGTVTFTTAATASWQVGLNYNINIKTMPVEAKMASGNIRGFKKRIMEVNADVYNTQSMTINDNPIQFRQFGTGVLDTAIQPFTGVKKAGPLLGFDKEGIITVTQGEPLKFNLLNMEFKVSIGQ
jgi:hypothetical protein